jgi:thiamine biosynthesis lipoprotein
MQDKRRSNRREFLKGRSAVDALSDLQEGVDLDQQPLPLADVDPASRRNYLMQVERRAMACRFQVFLNAGQHPAGIEAALEALDLVESLEAQLSVFRPDSELSRINQRAGQSACRVEPRLFRLLDYCLQLNSATDGAFDITASPLFQAWGFKDRRGRVPTERQLQIARQRVGCHHIELESDHQTIRFRIPELELNLGSIGKGHALDRCAEVLADADVDDYLIHGGQSSILARGSRGGRGSDGGWAVALPHPLRPDQRLAEIRLRNRAVGTSGSAKQFFYHQGRRYGHVLDPRNGQPAEGVLSATVLAASATDADALATAFFVMGIDQTRQFCQERPDLSVIFVTPGKRRDAVSIETLNLNDELVVVSE